MNWEMKLLASLIFAAIAVTIGLSVATIYG
jgi:hypothetical protein